MPGPVFIEGDSVELCTAERENVEFLQQGTSSSSSRE
jgi:hypothetical protein